MNDLNTGWKAYNSVNRLLSLGYDGRVRATLILCPCANFGFGFNSMSLALTCRTDSSIQIEPRIQAVQAKHKNPTANFDSWLSMRCDADYHNMQRVNERGQGSSGSSGSQGKPSK